MQVSSFASKNNCPQIKDIYLLEVAKATFIATLKCDKIYSAHNKERKILIRHRLDSIKSLEASRAL